jgi:hypothetical protein
MPSNVTVHRFEHTAVDTSHAGAATAGLSHATLPANAEAMTEEEQMALALSLSMMPEEQQKPAAADGDSTAAIGEGDAAAIAAAIAAAEEEQTAAAGAAAPVPEPLFDAHHEAGVSGHVSLRPGAFMHFHLGDTVEPGAEAAVTGTEAEVPASMMFGVQSGTRNLQSYGFGQRAAPAAGRPRGQVHESYTISMDIRVAALPVDEPLPLLSCCADTGASRGTSELFL